MPAALPPPMLYRIVKRAKDGGEIGIGTLRTRRGRPVEVEIRVAAAGTFALVPDYEDAEVTVPRGRPKSER
jgi:hypothetical protein